MKATLLKRLDALLGPLLVRLLPNRKPAGGAGAPGSILVIRPGGIGDSILLVPALRALQASFPGCRIDILAEKRNAAAFLLCPGLHAVHRYDSPSELLFVLRQSFDVVIDTEQWYRLSAIVARIVSAPRSLGFDSNERGGLCTHPVPYSLHEYEALSFFTLLAPLGIYPPEEIATPFLAVPTAAVQASRKLLAPLGGKAYVAVFPGASVPEKEWGIDRFRVVASSLAAAGIAVVVVGGEDTREAGERIAKGGVALNLAGKGALLESAALIGGASVLVSGDSGLLHLAAGLGTPTVSLFGPSDPVKWGPKGEGHRVFRPTPTCAPCSKWGTIPPCPDKARCMAATTPTEVVAAVKEVVGDGKS